VNLYGYVGGNPVNGVDIEGLDTAGCDGIPDFLETPCRLECCAAHDECFDKNNCDSSSWYSRCSKECDKCNDTVKKCFMACKGKKDNPNKPNYYCAKLHKYVRIPGDFIDYKTAKRFCSSP